MTAPIARDGGIHVSDCRVARAADAFEISCRVIAPGLTLPERLYYRFLIPTEAEISPSADPFLPVLLLLGVATSRSLTLDGPVSPALIAQASAVMRTWQSWNDRYRPVAVSASSRRVTTDRPAAAACFFSGGVDSFYTMLSIASRYPAGDPRAITHLVLCHGFDIPLADHERFERARRSAEQVASESGHHLVPCVTNARAFTREIDWLRFAFGPCLAGVGLALQPLVGTVYISSGRAYHQLKPEASHTLLDPLWSTESLDVIHAGAEALRGDKTAAIAHSPLVRRHLRVCWQNTSDVNCCRCEKCMRTMLELELQGVLAESPTFGESLTPGAISAIRVEPFAVHYYEYWLQRARSSDVDHALVLAVEELLARERFDRGAIGMGVERMVLRPLAAVGLTPHVLKKLDAVLFGGRAMRRLRSGRKRLL